jgi:hypothetical protein
MHCTNLEGGIIMDKKWWKAAGVRAVKTVAEAAFALIPAAATITAVDWKTVVGTAALAGVTSLLVSIKGLPELQGTKK